MSCCSIFTLVSLMFFPWHNIWLLFCLDALIINYVTSTADVSRAHNTDTDILFSVVFFFSFLHRFLCCILYMFKGQIGVSQIWGELKWRQNKTYCPNWIAELQNIFVWHCLLRFDSWQHRGRQEMTGERAKMRMTCRKGHCCVLSTLTIWLSWHPVLQVKFWDWTEQNDSKGISTLIHTSLSCTIWWKSPTKFRKKLNSSLGEYGCVYCLLCGRPKPGL